MADVDRSFEERRERRRAVKVALGLEDLTLEEKLDEMERRADAGDPDAIECCKDIEKILDHLEAKLDAHEALLNRVH